MSKTKKEKLVLNQLYNTHQGSTTMLVVEFPFYHFRRMQGWRYRDLDGIYRTASGGIYRDGFLSSLDITTKA